MEVALIIGFMALLGFTGYREWLELRKKNELLDKFAAERKVMLKEFQKERIEMLDRLMSRDLTEYKVVSEPEDNQLEPEEDDMIPLHNPEGGFTDEEKEEVAYGGQESN